MLRPHVLTQDAPLVWSTGRGTDVWELFCACIRGDLPAVHSLVARDPALVRAHHAYRTPLHFAVRENRTEVAAFLLERGADPLSLAVNDSLVQVCRDRGYAAMEQLLQSHLASVCNASERAEPVAQAIRDGDLCRVAALLDANPGLLHAGDLRSNQPIHWAVMTRQIDLIDELLRRGADPNAPRYDGARPIQLTNGDYFYRGWRDVPLDCAATPRQVLDHLRQNGADLDLSTACDLGDESRVRALLAEDRTLVNRVSPYVSYYPSSGAPIKNAAEGGHLELVKLLLEHGADPNLPEEGIAPRGHALYAAAAKGHHAIAHILLEHGADPNPEVESSADALSRAIANGDQPMVDLLCSYGASRAMHLLGYYGDVRTAAALFAARPELAEDPEALANAAGQGHEAFVRLMLRSVPDLPRRLQFADWSVGAKTPELNALLFAHGLNPSQRDWLMITPLHQFARRGDISAAAQFLDHGADLHARDEEICSTPLGWAAKYGQTEMVEFLLERGAMPQHPDDPPWATPLAWAIRRGHDRTGAILRQKGAC